MEPTFRLLVDLGPPLAGLAHNRGVDEGSQFLQSLLAFSKLQSHGESPTTHPQVVSDHSVEQVHIVFAQCAEIEELVDRSVLQPQLGQTPSLLGFIALGARGSETVGT